MRQTIEAILCRLGRHAIYYGDERHFQIQVPTTLFEGMTRFCERRYCDLLEHYRGGKWEKCVYSECVGRDERTDGDPNATA
ncbi:MAG: hypothetical protein ABID84_03225 [Chloroflexota bacterium]